MEVRREGKGEVWKEEKRKEEMKEGGREVRE